MLSRLGVTPEDIDEYERLNAEYFHSYMQTATERDAEARHAKIEAPTCLRSSMEGILKNRRTSSLPPEVCQDAPSRMRIETSERLSECH